MNQALLTLDRNNNPESAFFFNGIDQYLTFSDPDFLPIFSSPRSFTAWINISELGSNGSQVILQYGTTNQNSGLFQFGINNAEGKLFFTGFNNDIISNLQISSNEWTFVGIVYTGSFSEIQFFINGKKDIGIVQTILNTQIGTYRETIGMGGEKSNALTDGFKGIIDDIRIYNRALSNNELQILFEE